MDTTLQPAAAETSAAAPDSLAATPQPPEVAATPPPGTRRVRRVWNAGLLVVIVVAGTLLAGASPGLLNPSNLLAQILIPLSWLAVLALGVTIVFVTGNVDLSAGGIFLLAGAVTAAVVGSLPQETGVWPSFSQLLSSISAGHFPPAQAFGVYLCAYGLPVLIGIGCGLLNGGLVVGLRVHWVLVTIGTLAIFRGMALGMSSAGVKTAPAGANLLEHVWIYHGRGGEAVGFAPLPVVVMLGCIVIGWLFLNWSVAGREWRAVGGNEEAARYSGIPVGRVKVWAFVLSGLLAGIAAIVGARRHGPAGTGGPVDIDLTVIAAVVVGGARLRGARGSAWGALLGAILIQLIHYACTVACDVTLRIPGSYFQLPAVHLGHSQEKVLLGVAILIALIFGGRRQTRAGRSR